MTARCIECGRAADVVASDDLAFCEAHAPGHLACVAAFVGAGDLSDEALSAFAGEMESLHGDGIEGGV